MTQTSSPARRFTVWARHIDSHHARIVSEPTFEAAAIAYAEDLHIGTDTDEISIIVKEIDSGHQHSFRVDLGTGEAASLD